MRHRGTSGETTGNQEKPAASQTPGQTLGGQASGSANFPDHLAIAFRHKNDFFIPLIFKIPVQFHITRIIFKGLLQIL